jgi:hypothetical protein
MSLKISLALLLAATATLAQAQTNDSIRDSYHIFFPAAGKDILAAHVGDHSYKLVSINNKPAELYVDNKKIETNEWTKYDAVIQKIKASITTSDDDRDMEQAERDREQADRDREQADRDREQADRDREQANHDREHADRDREQASRDQEQAQRDQKQALHDQQQVQRDQEHAQHDQEQAQRDQQQARRDQEQARRDQENNWEGTDCNCNEDDVAYHREQAAEDRLMLKKGIQYLVDEHIISNAGSLKTLVLTSNDVSVNGVKQPQNIYQQMRTKLGDWAHNGMSYGATGPAENYSLSIND